MPLNADPARLPTIERSVQRLIDGGHFAGAAWHVRLRGEPVSDGVAGLADVAANTPLSRDAIYRIYSMTKPVVSVVALQLMEEGALRLDLPISLFLPEFRQMQILQGGRLRPAQSPITVDHLFTHRAGFSYDFLPGCPVAALYRESNLLAHGEASLQGFVESLAPLPLGFEPGTSWYYSYATDVLARLLEVVSGQSLQSLLQERIFAPLGMHDTAYRVPADKQPRVLPVYGTQNLDVAMALQAQPHELTEVDVRASYPLNNESFARGGHGLYSTLDDYARFLPVLMSGCGEKGHRVLSEPMVDMMWRNRLSNAQQSLAIGPAPLAGYGWNLFGRVLMDPGQSMILSGAGEGGWAGAASTFFWVDRQRQLDGLVMAQYLMASVPLGQSVQMAAYQALVDS